MRNLVRIIAFFLIFAISVGAEAGKRSGGFGGHGWGKSSHSSHIKLKKKNTKKKYIAGASADSVGASAGAENPENIGSDDNNKTKYENISKETKWASAQTLKKHFEKHGSDFNSVDARDYANKANYFYLNSSKNKSIRKKLDDKGIVRIWDPSTNEFGSFTKDGKTKTYFKPNSQSYWARQEGREIYE